MKGTVVRTAELQEYLHPKHERYFLRDVVTSATHPGLSLHRGRIEPGGEILVHVHEEQTETFYVLSGQALCTMGKETLSFGPGSCGVAPPGVPHGLKNPGSEPVELLALFTPPLK